MKPPRGAPHSSEPSNVDHCFHNNSQLISVLKVYQPHQCSNLPKRREPKCAQLVEQPRDSQNSHPQRPRMTSSPDFVSAL